MIYSPEAEYTDAEWEEAWRQHQEQLMALELFHKISPQRKCVLCGGLMLRKEQSQVHEGCIIRINRRGR